MPDSVRQERCCCGGLLATPWPCNDEEIVRVVRQHNDTMRHRLWQQRGGMQSESRRVDYADAYEGRIIE